MNGVDNEKMDGAGVIVRVLLLKVLEWEVFPSVEIDLKFVGSLSRNEAPEFGEGFGEIRFSSTLPPLVEGDGFEGEPSVETRHLVYPVLSLVSLSLPVQACLSKFLDERP